MKMKNPNAFPIGKKFGFFICGGPEETRTLDLSDANRTLCRVVRKAGPSPFTVVVSAFV